MRDAQFSHTYLHTHLNKHTYTSTHEYTNTSGGVLSTKALPYFQLQYLFHYTQWHKLHINRENLGKFEYGYVRIIYANRIEHVIRLLSCTTIMSFSPSVTTTLIFSTIELKYIFVESASNLQIAKGRNNEFKIHLISH